MKNQWQKPEITDLSVKNTFGKGNTGNTGENCPLCGHPITHPEDPGHPGNHKGKCPNNNSGTGGGGDVIDPS